MDVVLRDVHYFVVEYQVVHICISLPNMPKLLYPLSCIKVADICVLVPSPKIIVHLYNSISYQYD